MKKKYIRISKRVYPIKKCKQCNEEFIPTDARQVYCSAQHRIDFNNDKRCIKNAPVKKINIGLAKNEKILEKSYKFMQKHKQDEISMDFLLFDGYDLNVLSETSRSKLGNIIEWQLSYGLEGTDEERNLFKIHHR